MIWKACKSGKGDLHVQLHCSPRAVLLTGRWAVRMPSCSWRRVLAFVAVYFPVWAFAFAPRPPCDAFRLRGRRAALSCCSTKGGATTAAAQDWTGVLPFLPPERFRSASPAESLSEGEWFKLICGASFEVRSNT